MKYLKTIFVAIIIVVFCVLYVQNEAVFTHQFRLNFDLSVYKVGPYLVYNVALIGAAFVLGVLFSLIYGIFHSTGKSSELSKKDAKIRDLENRISDMKKDSGTTGQSSTGTGVFSPPSGTGN